MHSLTPAAIPAAASTKRQGATPKATPYAIIGNGWRSSVFIRMAYLMPQRFELVGVVTRRAEAGAALERDWGVETYKRSMTSSARNDPTSSCSACRGR